MRRRRKRPGWRRGIRYAARRDTAKERWL